MKVEGGKNVSEEMNDGQVAIRGVDMRSVSYPSLPGPSAVGCSPGE